MTGDDIPGWLREARRLEASRRRPPDFAAISARQTAEQERLAAAEDVRNRELRRQAVAQLVGEPRPLPTGTVANQLEEIHAWLRRNGPLQLGGLWAPRASCRIAHGRQLHRELLLLRPESAHLAVCWLEEAAVNRYVLWRAATAQHQRGLGPNGQILLELGPPPDTEHEAAAIRWLVNTLYWQDVMRRFLRLTRDCSLQLGYQTERLLRLYGPHPSLWRRDRIPRGVRGLVLIARRNEDLPNMTADLLGDMQVAAPQTEPSQRVRRVVFQGRRNDHHDPTVGGS